MWNDLQSDWVICFWKGFHSVWSCWVVAVEWSWLMFRLTVILIWTPVSTQTLKLDIIMQLRTAGLQQTSYFMSTSLSGDLWNHFLLSCLSACLYVFSHHRVILAHMQLSLKGCTLKRNRVVLSIYVYAISFKYSWQLLWQNGNITFSQQTYSIWVHFSTCCIN